jgi:hypothetical protein
MEWVWPFLPLLPAAAFWLWMGWTIWDRRYKWKLDEPVWFSDWPKPRPRDLGLIHSFTEYNNVFHVRSIATGKVHIVGRFEMRRIRWWQRNKVDPIIMKYWLLGGPDA